MIPRLAWFLARALLETALLLLAVGLLFGMLAWRVGRRTLTERPGRLDRTADGLERVARIAAAFSRQFAQAGDVSVAATAAEE